MTFIRHPGYPDYVLVKTLAAGNYFKQELDKLPACASWPCTECPVLNLPARFCDSSCRRVHETKTDEGYSVVWVKEITAIAMMLETGDVLP